MADAAGGSSIGCGAVSDLALCSLSLSLRVFFSDEGFASAGFSSGSNQSSGPLIPSLIDAYTDDLCRLDRFGSALAELLDARL